jgi:hypothetical protein
MLSMVETSGYILLEPGVGRRGNSNLNWTGQGLIDNQSITNKSAVNESERSVVDPVKGGLANGGFYKVFLFVLLRWSFRFGLRAGT